MNKKYETKLVKLYIAEYFSVSRWAEDCHITEAEGQRMLDENSKLFSSPSEPDYIYLSIEGNPYQNEDFFIYKNGKEVVSWNVDEMAEDEFSEETAKEMYDLYKEDKKELGKRLDRISFAKD